MSGGVFVDTNILIYAHDADAGSKRQRAVEQLRELWASGTGCISVQVLQEFYANVTRKLSTPIAYATARQIIGTYAAWVRSETTPQTVLRAAEIAESSKISFWDAMILAAAEECDASVLWSEDLDAGQTITGIKVVNPLK